MLIGLVACFIGIAFPTKTYKNHAFKLYLLAIILLLVTLSPLGVKINGAQRWLNLGLLQFQPSEIMKFSLVVLTALFLDRKKTKTQTFFQMMFPLLLIVIGPLVLIIMQPDLGNTILITLVLFSILFISKIPLAHILIISVISISGLVISIINTPYQLQRIINFLNPFADPLNKSYHIIQSFIAIGSGGITGLGLGESKMKYFYLPLQYSDFIFAIICEEGGFILACILLLLYLYILVKGYQIAKNTNSTFHFNLCFGLTLMIILQAFINIAVVIGLLPITGMPLTFVSFGGTSLITSLFYIGVIINISQNNLSSQFNIKKQ